MYVNSSEALGCYHLLNSWAPENSHEGQGNELSFYAKHINECFAKIFATFHC